MSLHSLHFDRTVSVPWRAILRGRAISPRGEIAAAAIAIAVCLWAIVSWPPECSTDPGFKIGAVVHLAGCP
ncbi:hypothetical protein [Bradyrhizobium sp. SZCCHNR1098]|uniref:hypothetical protein n=1 Tax=Bradyrhizobium sp. SZCCHNR1098 TaxID=3057370 RepID=UPI0029162801|nr:hypothetical protein [Bradyrhizobium sp. SZCCHNR1098]